MTDRPAGSNGSGSKSLLVALIAVIVVLVVISGVGWGLYATKSSYTTNSPNLSAVEAKSEVTALAYEHWQAIGTENLSQTVSQYSSGSVLYWNVKGSLLNGIYSNISAIKNTWSKFFQHDPIDYYSIYNFNISVSGDYANVTADLWYLVLVNSSDNVGNISGLTSIKGNGTVNSTVATLILPYLLTYQYIDGKWYLQGDWWGLPSPHDGFLVKGIAEQLAQQLINSTAPSSGCLLYTSDAADE